MLKKQKVKEVMTENVITVPPSEDVVFAFEKLMKYKVSALPVVDNDKLVGIVTATDLGHNLILDKYALGTRVADVMVKNIACIKPEDDLSDAIRKMKEFGVDEGIVNQLVVVENNNIKGIISDGDIIRAIRCE
ncbi:CBS domain-containing protein [Methanobacterium oryzae]|uniref:CBS domain-containing protein n=1 Tax=Methanobacterium oryzae TaxID=69540 RepID=UPI003D1D4BFB